MFSQKKPGYHIFGRSFLEIQVKDTNTVLQSEPGACQVDHEASFSVPVCSVHAATSEPLWHGVIPSCGRIYVI